MRKAWTVESNRPCEYRYNDHIIQSAEGNVTITDLNNNGQRIVVQWEGAEYGAILMKAARRVVGRGVPTDPPTIS